MSDSSPMNSAKKTGNGSGARRKSRFCFYVLLDIQFMSVLVWPVGDFFSGLIELFKGEEHE
jgi:hypothetical protein